MGGLSETSYFQIYWFVHFPTKIKKLAKKHSQKNFTDSFWWRSSVALQDKKFKATVLLPMKMARKWWEKLQKDIKRIICEYIETNCKDLETLWICKNCGAENWLTDERNLAEGFSSRFERPGMSVSFTLSVEMISLRVINQTKEQLLGGIRTTWCVLTCPS